MRFIETEEGELSLLAARLREQFEGADEVRVLEAGCGRRWRLNPGDLPLRITGVDADPDVIQLRIEREGDLAEARVGDLLTEQFAPGSFDVVYCSFVLEHVAGAEALLDRMTTWLAPGGLLLLRLPDRDSVYGFVTRHTPHRLHVWFRRRLIGMPHAGEPGHGPFPVVYDEVVSAAGIQRWADAAGLEVVDACCSAVYLTRLGRLGPPIAFGTRVAARLSGGRLSADHNNLLFVLRRPVSTPIDADLQNLGTVAQVPQPASNAHISPAGSRPSRRPPPHRTTKWGFVVRPCEGRPRLGGYVHGTHGLWH